MHSLDGVGRRLLTLLDPTDDTGGTSVTRIYNAERGFKDEYLEGLTAAYGRYLRRVPGASAVMSVDAPVPGQVSVIIGGGSGPLPRVRGPRRTRAVPWRGRRRGVHQPVRDAGVPRHHARSMAAPGCSCPSATTAAT